MEVINKNTKFCGLQDLKRRLKDPGNYTPEGIRRLSLAILVLAIVDSSPNDCLRSDIKQESRSWILNYGAMWAQLCGLPLSQQDFTKWADAGYPIKNANGKQIHLGGKHNKQLQDQLLAVITNASETESNPAEKQFESENLEKEGEKHGSKI